MPYDPQIHRRRSIRLKGYDYTQPGAYFVTVCTQNRARLFGDVVNGKMVLNDAGIMVRETWQSMRDRFPDIRTDVYVIMPNHCHAIVTLVGATLVVAPDVVAPDVVAPDVVAPDVVAPERAGTSPAPTGTRQKTGLGDVVGAFKSITTHEYIVGVREMGWPPFDKRLWQRNYWEHVIRTPDAYAKIEDYITSNPAGWLDDRLHSDASSNSFGQDR